MEGDSSTVSSISHVVAWAPETKLPSVKTLLFEADICQFIPGLSYLCRSFRFWCNYAEYSSACILCDVRLSGSPISGDWNSAPGIGLVCGVPVTSSYR